MPEQLRHELFEDADVRPGQVQARLARSLFRAGRDHHDVGAFRHRDIAAAGDGGGRRGELGAVGEVQDFRFGFEGIDVEQGDVAGRTADQGGVGQRGAHAPGAHHGKFGS
ncbi:hypothetical protein D9M72_513670 [compost metagenome]